MKLNYVKYHFHYIGKSACGQKKQSRVESFQHCSQHSEPPLTAGGSMTEASQRAPTRGYTREWNGGIAYIGGHISAFVCVVMCLNDAKDSVVALCEALSTLEIHTIPQSQWVAPARKIIGNGWMKSDCDYTTIHSGHGEVCEYSLYESSGIAVSGFVLRKLFPWWNTNAWHKRNQAKAKYGLESVGTVSFQTREFPEQRNIELQRLWQTCKATRRAKEVLRFHQRITNRKSQLFFWFGRCLCRNVSLGVLFTVQFQDNKQLF